MADEPSDLEALAALHRRLEAFADSYWARPEAIAALHDALRALARLIRYEAANLYDPPPEQD